MTVCLEDENELVKWFCMECCYEWRGSRRNLGKPKRDKVLVNEGKS